jgi:hypothetical protein
MQAQELLHFDMAVVQDGAIGGIKGAIYHHWKKSDSAYDEEIAGAITHHRWLQIKRVYKLCDNDLAPKKDADGYDQSYKYDYIYKCLICNINEMTQFLPN